MAEHHHPHDHHHHRPDHPGWSLRGAAALTIGFAVVEALGGWWTGSLALLSDAGHMITDGAALALGASAGSIAKRPPPRRWRSARSPAGGRSARRRGAIPTAWAGRKSSRPW